VVRRWGKPDANQAAIVEALRGIPECSVLVLSAVGRGCPDLLIGYRGANLLVEVKNPDHEKIGGQAMEETRARQTKFRESWKGAVVRATSLKEIITAMTGWNA
jgi:hypothetical protein